MSDSRKRKATAIQDAIRQILYRQWDPIGVVGMAPEDEYDFYIGSVYGILAGSRSEDEIIAYLQESETESMRLTPATPAEELRPIAKALLELDVTL